MYPMEFLSYRICINLVLVDNYQNFLKGLYQFLLHYLIFDALVPGRTSSLERETFLLENEIFLVILTSLRFRIYFR